MSNETVVDSARARYHRAMKTRFASCVPVVIVLLAAGCGSKGDPAVDVVEDSAEGDALDAADGADGADNPGLVTFDVPRPPTARAEPWRPQVHYSPEAGWINDPVGLVYAEGEYHLFQQANPEVPFWGELQWGHQVGTDLLRWTSLAPALVPDADLGQPFSGSGFVVDGAARAACATGPGAPDSCLAVMFTHHGGSDGTEKQSLAVSIDRGRTWVLHPRSPVLRQPDLTDFRDPKVFRVEEGWVLVAAAGDRARFYSSPDLLDWTPSGTFGPVEGLEGTWECPDLFELPIDGDPLKTAWVFKIDTNRGLAAARPDSWAFTGTFDGKVFAPAAPQPRIIDHGPDFYAAQSWSDAPAGRRTWIAWMDHWSYALITPTEAWRGALTLPRDLRLVDRGGVPVLVQAPVDLASLDLGVLARAGRFDVDGAADLSGPVGGYPLDVTFRLAPGTWSRAGLRLFVGGGAGAVAGDAFPVDPEAGAVLVGYDRDRGEVFLDRSGALGTGVDTLFGGRFAAARPADVDGGITFRVIADRSSVEVFSGDVTITALVFPDPAADRMGLFTIGAAATFEPLEVRALDTIWPAP